MTVLADILAAFSIVSIAICTGIFTASFVRVVRADERERKERLEEERKHREAVVAALSPPRPTRVRS